MTPDVRTLADAAAVCAEGAAVVQRAAADAVRDTGVCRIALSGGSAPKGLYSLLAGDARLREAMPWSAIEFFFGDERHVPPDDPQSNYRMAREAMLARVPIRPEQVHRIRSERADADVAAREYEEELRAVFRSGAEAPQFDLMLLGLGPDGHTASLFPGTQALSETTRLVVANWVEKLKTHRITMTLPVLNRSRFVMFVTTGAEKAAAIRNVLQPSDAAPRLPAQLVQPESGRVLWLIDRAAGSFLRPGAHRHGEAQPDFPETSG